MFQKNRERKRKKKKKLTKEPDHKIHGIFNELATKSEKWNANPRLACVNVRHPPLKTYRLEYTESVREITADRLAKKSNHREWLESRKILSVEELETLPADTKPRASHHRSPGGEMSRTKKGRHRAIVSQTNIGTASKATLEKRGERDGVERTIMGFSEHTDTILN